MVVLCVWCDLSLVNLRLRASVHGAFKMTPSLFYWWKWVQAY